MNACTKRAFVSLPLFRPALRPLSAGALASCRFKSTLKTPLNRKELPPSVALQYSTAAHENVEPAKAKESFFKRNEALGRPMSPHLAIYKKQLTSTLSISHRAAGIAMGALAYGLAVMPLLSVNSAQLALFVHSLPLPLIVTAKLLVGTAFSFKVLAGIRHLVWDTAKSLTLRGVYTSGYTVLALTAVGGVALAIM